jgi:hypothetical protein
MKRLLLSMFAVAASLSCGGSEGSVDPADPNELSQVLVIPGAVREQGSPPVSRGGSSAPMIMGGSALMVTSGNQAVLSVQFRSNSGYRNCYVQVQGARDYFRIPGSESANSGEIRIPVNVPNSVATGNAQLYTCIADADGNVSNPVSTPLAISNPSSSGSGSGGETCSPQQSLSGCTLSYCVDRNATRCAYQVNGVRIPCGNCTDISACAQTAVMRLTECTRR